MNEHIGTIGNVTLKHTALAVLEVRAALTAKGLHHNTQKATDVLSLNKSILLGTILDDRLKTTHLLVHGRYTVVGIVTNGTPKLRIHTMSLNGSNEVLQD